jgi:hypothetical protein
MLITSNPQELGLIPAANAAMWQGLHSINRGCNIHAGQDDCDAKSLIHHVAQTQCAVRSHDISHAGATRCHL